VSFVFHACLGEPWKPTVRPPRLGGNRRLGVFATRSTHRPNPIGLSVLELERVVAEPGRVELHLKGVDLMDGTPVLDIKPYLPYVDSLPDAAGGFAPDAPAARFEVRFSPGALDVCATAGGRAPGMEVLIRQILGHDPRPAYYGKDDSKRTFGMRLFDYDVKWEVAGDAVCVTDIVEAG